MPSEPDPRGALRDDRDEHGGLTFTTSDPSDGAIRRDSMVGGGGPFAATRATLDGRYFRQLSVPFVDDLVAVGSWHEFWTEAESVRTAPPDFASFGSEPKDEAGGRLLMQVGIALDAEPLEALIDHRAEDILADALEGSVPSATLDAIRDCCLSDDGRVRAADLLRCLARLSEPGTEQWRADLIRDALKAEDVEVRDAALEAAEAWRSRSMLGVLRAHRDPDPELRSEIAEIVGTWER